MRRKGDDKPGVLYRACHRLVCHLTRDREQRDSLGACVSRNGVKLIDQDSYTIGSDTLDRLDDVLNIRSCGVS